MRITQQFTGPLRKLHDDEEGLEAVQVVMIVAIAALVLIGVMTIGQEVFNWMREKWNELKGQDIG
jgi:Flp pilus assembly pilin Flp